MKGTAIQFHPTERVLRQFSAAWLLCFLGLGVKFGLLQLSTAGLVLGLIALAGAGGLIVPRWMRWTFVAASAAAFPVGWVVSQVALGIVFYGVLTPMALLLRWRGRDALQLRKPQAVSFWDDHRESPDPESYLKQF